MATEPRVKLLTGSPGVGKTTIIKEAVARMGGGAGGFYTEEIRVAGDRKGFRIVTLTGPQGVLAHVDLGGPHRVGKYGVNIDDIDGVAVPALHQAIGQRWLVVIDEIGRMELFSTAFRQGVEAALNSDCRVLATIMLRPHPWADGVKGHPAADLLLVTRENRLRVGQEILRWLDISKG